MSNLVEHSNDKFSRDETSPFDTFMEFESRGF